MRQFQVVVSALLTLSAVAGCAHRPDAARAASADGGACTALSWTGSSLPDAHDRLKLSGTIATLREQGPDGTVAAIQLTLDEPVCDPHGRPAREIQVGEGAIPEYAALAGKRATITFDGFHTARFDGHLRAVIGVPSDDGSPSGTSSPAASAKPGKPVLEVRLKMEDERDKAHNTLLYGDCVVLRAAAAKGSPPREICTNAERGDLIPMFRQQQLTVTERPPTVLRLGWTTIGGGDATVHAWIVRAEEGKAPEVVDKAAWTAKRGSVGFIVDESKTLRLGVPWTFDDPFTSQAETKLEFATRNRWLHVDEVKKLPFEKTASTLPFYTGAFGEKTQPAGTRVLWLDVTASGFAGLPVSRSRTYAN
jgi:hypothetical protein